VWLITSGQPALSAHVLVDPGADCHATRLLVEDLLRRDYQLTHTTLQVDHASADTLLQIDAGTADRHCVDALGAVHRSGEHGH
jgi:cobalt-zinc-cadmium efflux system protein